MLEVCLLGGFGLRLNGRPVDSLKPGRALELLTFLLVSPEQALARAHVAAMFWPDTEEGQARTNLRRELHTLKNALPDSAASPLKDLSELAFARLLQGLAEGQDPEPVLQELRRLDAKRMLLFGHRYQARRHLRRRELKAALIHAEAAWRTAEAMGMAADQALAAAIAVRVCLLEDRRQAAAEWVKKVRKLQPAKVGARGMGALRQAMREGGRDGQSGGGGQLAGAVDPGAADG